MRKELVRHAFDQQHKDSYSNYLYCLRAAVNDFHFHYAMKTNARIITETFTARVMLRDLESSLAIQNHCKEYCSVHTFINAHPSLCVSLSASLSTSLSRPAEASLIPIGLKNIILRKKRD